MQVPVKCLVVDITALVEWCVVETVQNAIRHALWLSYGLNAEWLPYLCYGAFD